MLLEEEPYYEALNQSLKDPEFRGTLMLIRNQYLKATAKETITRQALTKLEVELKLSLKDL